MVTPFLRTREAIELAQQFDLDMDFVLMGVRGYAHKWSGHGLSRRYAALEEIDHIRTEPNEPHEVIVLAVFMADWFPMEIVDEILRQVKEDGTGLVISLGERFYGPLEDIHKKAKDHKGLRACKSLSFGKGRVLFLEGTSRELHTDWVDRGLCTAEGVPSEDGYAEIGQALLWAAQRASIVSMGKLDLPRSEQRDSLVRRKLVVPVSNAFRDASRGTIRLRPRRNLTTDHPFYSVVKHGRRFYASWEVHDPVVQKLELAAGEKRDVDLTLPTLASGRLPTGCQRAGREGSYRGLAMRAAQGRNGDDHLEDPPGAAGRQEVLFRLRLVERKSRRDGGGCTGWMFRRPLGDSGAGLTQQNCSCTLRRATI